MWEGVMNEQVEYNAELNGIVLEYTEMLSTMQKLIFDYTNAKTDEAKDFINYEIQEYKRQLTILKQRIASFKARNNK